MKDVSTHDRFASPKRCARELFENKTNVKYVYVYNISSLVSRRPLIIYGSCVSERVRKFLQTLLTIGEIRTKGRITEVEFFEGKGTVMQDSWENDYGIKMLNREWTGKTIFLARGKPREVKPKLDEHVQALIAARFDAVVSKNSKKERGKVFDLERCDEQTKNGIIGSRTTKWLKWKKFLAAQIVAGRELQELLKDGHKPVPTQWIDTDKNERLKREGKHHEILHKSRLVARGDLEQSHDEIRTDSPTVETEALNIILAWTASFVLRIRSIDITNAYFHGEKMDRLMSLQAPEGRFTG